jgi:excisionase family DNA binding protein
MVANKDNFGQILFEESIMTAVEVAAFLKVSVGAVRRWTRDGKLKGHRMGGQGDWRYLKKDVMLFLYGTN